MSEGETDLNAWDRIQACVPEYDARRAPLTHDFPATIITGNVPVPGFLIGHHDAAELVDIAHVMGDNINGVPIYYQLAAYLRLADIVAPECPPEPRTRTVQI